MEKWADCLVSAVSYNPDREITGVEVREDLGGKMGPVEIIDKLTMSHNMRRGKTYATITKMLDSWKRGREIHLYLINGNPFLRIDKNKVSLDNLGDLPDIDYTKKVEPRLDSTAGADDKKTVTLPPPTQPRAPEPHVELKSDVQSPLKSEPKEKPASPHGTLPAAGEIEIPFEDIQPDPIADAPDPEPAKPTEHPKERSEMNFLDYERDYLRRLEEQKKQDELTTQARVKKERQIVEIERRARLEREEYQRQRLRTETSEQANPASSSRGSLPMEGEIQVPFEEMQPEQASVLDTVRTRHPHGTLPAGGDVDILFEQAQPPQADDDQGGAAKVEEMDFDDDDEDKEPTPEQLARFEDLEGQLEEAIRQSELIDGEPDQEVVHARQDTVPAREIRPEYADGITENLHEGARSTTSEEAVTAEQYERLENLATKVRELESAILAQRETVVAPDPRADTVEGMLEKFDETADRQIEQLEELEDHIAEIEDSNIELALVEKLRRQEARLGAIEERIADSMAPTQEQIDRVVSLEKQIAALEKQKRKRKVSDVVAYCVKCRTKRGMLNPTKTVMKNGRSAVRGTCSVCGTRMFRITSYVSEPEDDAPTRKQLDRVAKLEKQIAELADRQQGMIVSGYCLKCKTRRDMEDLVQTTMKNGRPTMRGTCPVCGVRMFKIGKMHDS